MTDKSDEGEGPADTTGVVNAVTADGQKLKDEIAQKRRKVSGQFRMLFEQLKNAPLSPEAASVARGSIPDR